MVHRRSDLSPFIPHGPMIYSVPEETIPLGDSLHDLMTFGKSTGIPMVLSFYPQLMVSFVIIFTQLKKIHSGSTKSLSKTYQIEYPLYIPFISPLYPQDHHHIFVLLSTPHTPFLKRNRVTGIQTIPASSIESAGYILIDYPYKTYKQSPSYPKKQWGLLRTVYNVYRDINPTYPVGQQKKLWNQVTGRCLQLHPIQRWWALLPRPLRCCHPPAQHVASSGS